MTSSSLYPGSMFQFATDGRVIDNENPGTRDRVTYGAPCKHQQPPWQPNFPKCPRNQVNRTFGVRP